VAITITVNGRRHEVAATPDTPLLYVLRNELGLSAPLYGCGLEQCGACMVLRGAEAVTTCMLPVAEADGEVHPVQQAFLDEQAAQCGYCSNGMIIAIAALLWRTPHPTDAQVCAALDGNLCRCGSHARILRAVRRAETLMWGGES
jgi:nicotinate dehydrogenase subunit A